MLLYVIRGKCSNNNSSQFHFTIGGVIISQLTIIISVSYQANTKWSYHIIGKKTIHRPTTRHLIVNISFFAPVLWKISFKIITRKEAILTEPPYIHHLTTSDLNICILPLLIPALSLYVSALLILFISSVGILLQNKVQILYQERPQFNFFKWKTTSKKRKKVRVTLCSFKKNVTRKKITPFLWKIYIPMQI